MQPLYYCTDSEISTMSELSENFIANFFGDFKKRGLPVAARIGPGFYWSWYLSNVEIGPRLTPLAFFADPQFDQILHRWKGL